MPTQIDNNLKSSDLLPAIARVFDLAGHKARLIDKTWDPANGTPVYTVNGQYTTRGWTEWTQGFQYGCSLLAFDATDDKELLELGRRRTVDLMLPHVTHTGVHDHGFNNLSTYGNLRRLMREGRIDRDDWEHEYYGTVIKVSGAVQAARWSKTAADDPAKGGGYIPSFNGPHSLFIDTMRTLRILSAGHQLGHTLMGEHDERINLLGRAIQHALTTDNYIIFHGDTQHTWDVRGRTAHEGIFNRNDGRFRCRSTQQGYSPFSTWTRGLSWAMVGYPEELEFLQTRDDADVKNASGLDKKTVMQRFETAARHTIDHYLSECSTTDGITYWDDHAPGLAQMPDCWDKPADPYNKHEPVDATASAIGAQGMIRLGRYLGGQEGQQYIQAGLTVARTLFDEPYLSTDKNHQGMLLHSIYHRPNNWDHIPEGQSIPCHESSMWGDYHLLELANLIKRLAEDGPYPTFFDQ